MRFIDLRDAGRRLAADLARRAFDEPIVIGLPRGGVPVAAEVANRLQMPLDVLVVRKLAYPRDPTVGMGAIAEGGIRIIDEDLVSQLEITPAQLDGVVADEDAELRRRVRWYRDSRAPLSVEGRSVIVVDDGVATGFIARSAIAALRRRQARHIVLAVPIGPAGTVLDLQRHADDVVCLHVASSFSSIRQSYHHFSPVSDAEVADLLRAHGGARHPNGVGTVQ